ncbi:MAG: hypothetical protein WC824_12925 [Bacteroidota bacterium]|jgi:hypothetical protein
MKRYLKNVLLFMTPLLLVAALYFVFDPFKVLGTYESYYASGMPDYVVLNRGYVSTETFVRHHPAHRYNSFIFGNSRSLFYQVADWKPLLGADASCFHFDGSDESLFSIYRKVLFLEKQNVSIANALIVIDQPSLSRAEEGSGHLIMTPPRLMDNANIISFQWSFISAYLDPRFLLAYYDFMLTGQFRDYMRGQNVLNAEPMTYDLTANEIRYPQFEAAITAGRYYIGRRLSIFGKREQKPRPYSPCLGPVHKRLLQEIQRIFTINSTVVRIVISPLYNQRTLHPRDLATLRRIFGPTTVFDYSGINDITNDYHNYYELSHYRPAVAARIMREVYREEKTTKTQRHK